LAISRFDSGEEAPVARSLRFAALLFSCLIATPAFAQSPGDIIERVQSFIRSAMSKGAQSRWSKLPEAEYSCVNQKLQERGESLHALVKRGVFPTDKRLADIRSQCRTAVASRPFQRLDKRAYKRSGDDTVITASSYQDCETACAKSASCAALTYFRVERICRLMPSPTELAADDGADSALRADAITGSVPTPSPGAAEPAKGEEPLSAK
jgi:hypothetical protein